MIIVAVDKLEREYSQSSYSGRRERELFQDGTDDPYGDQWGEFWGGVQKNDPNHTPLGDQPIIFSASSNSITDRVQFWKTRSMNHMVKHGFWDSEEMVNNPFMEAYTEGKKGILLPIHVGPQADARSLAYHTAIYFNEIMSLRHEMRHMNMIQAMMTGLNRQWDDLSVSHRSTYLARHGFVMNYLPKNGSHNICGFWPKTMYQLCEAYQQLPKHSGGALNEILFG